MAKTPWAKGKYTRFLTCLVICECVHGSRNLHFELQHAKYSFVSQTVIGIKDSTQSLSLIYMVHATLNDLLTLSMFMKKITLNKRISSFGIFFENMKIFYNNVCYKNYIQIKHSFQTNCLSFYKNIV